MLILLNGFPGVGKLTIAQELAEQMGGRVLDNHSVSNVAFSLFDFGGDNFYDTVRAVRDLAYERVLMLRPYVPVILTWVLTRDANGDEHWQAIRRLADERGCAFLAVSLSCDALEHARRVGAPGRASMRKLNDPEMVRVATARAELIEEGADRLLRLDTTDLAPHKAAERIAAWADGY